MPTNEPVRLFIGSSSEGRSIARNLQAELESHSACEVTRWDVNVFEPGGYALDSLTREAQSADFAVLVATADDKVQSRGLEEPSMRDNVLLELGIFLGALGRKRAYLLATSRDLKIPSDLLGLTNLPYQNRSDGNERAAVNAAVLQIEQQIQVQGPRTRSSRGASGTSRTADAVALDLEVDLLCASAVAQGWTVRTNSPTTLRLRSPRGRAHTLTKGKPHATRVALRRFAREVRADGLRVNDSVRRPVDESPH
ncbi:nucleotide-binding protein [Myceligenerans salitolerans]|uniref:Nucleotide-binding protein n=1 Tax=Myceligenerans salitolerans TaxID=1230528 RepID=A0ABS3IAC0_9MICO|nr:nucleotide-binding protein [Myceligenerans salitolerans]